jgi:hypothetical protein
MRKGLTAFLLCASLSLSIAFSGGFSRALAGQQAGGTASGGNDGKTDSSGSSKAAPSDSTRAPAKKKPGTYSQSAAAKAEFMRESGYRNGRPGFVVGYRKPLACGGTDDPTNMQWQTVAEAKATSKTQSNCK